MTNEEAANILKSMLYSISISRGDNKAINKLIYRNALSMAIDALEKTSKQETSIN